ncbi:signal peptidase II [Patescibacteria group bacterium]
MAKWLIWVTILTDQIAKYLVLTYFSSIVFLNKGVSFGLFPSGLWLGLNALLLLIFIYILKPSWGKHLILGGGISNIIDRIFRGGVVDFVNLKPLFLGLNLPVFNLADVFIAIGCIAVFLEIKTCKKN